MRLTNHADLTRYHQFYQGEGFPIRIERIVPLDDDPCEHFDVGLTPMQREGLLMALEKDAIAVPNEASLGEIADMLGLSYETVADRIE